MTTDKFKLKLIADEKSQSFKIQYHVWIDDSGNYNAIETGHMNSVEEIDRAVGGYNWYGLDAFSKEDAIAKAKQSGLKYRSPKEMSKLMDKCLNLQSQVNEFIV